MTFIKRFIVSLVILNFIIPTPLLAAVFNPNNIISYEDLIDYDSMSKDRIQLFLNQKTGVLKNRYFTYNGVRISASQIIFEAANQYNINPKYLLVLLQKEQSLITNPIPEESDLDWATGFAVCDSCSKNDPKIQYAIGFYNQVFLAAKRNRYYIDTAGQWNYVVGGTYNIDGQMVTMDNQATVNLYTYTPHIHGNENFHRLWYGWFSSKIYPDGSLLQVAGQPAVYLIKNGRKRAFWSKSAFLANYNPRNILTVSQNDIDLYNDGPPIKFSEYSLLQGPDEKTYLIAFNEKHLIESESVFRKIGYNPEEVIPVESGDLKSYPTGYSISMNSIYPTGVLLQSKQTGAVSYVKNGTRHGIVSKEILLSNFPKPSLIRVDDSEIRQYQPGEPLRFKDGTLITSPESHAVFVVSNGKRKRIASADVFNQLGYKWDNIVTTTDFAVRIHPSSQALNP